MVLFNSGLDFFPFPFLIVQLILQNYFFFFLLLYFSLMKYYILFVVLTLLNSGMDSSCFSISFPYDYFFFVESFSGTKIPGAAAAVVDALTEKVQKRQSN